MGDSASSSSSGEDAPVAANLHVPYADHDTANADIGKKTAQPKSTANTTSASISPNLKGVPEASSATEHVEDPIEPSEEPSQAADDDPIESDAPDQTGAPMFTPAATPGLTKKMKDRNGEISTTNIAQIASQIFQQHAAGPGSKRDDSTAVSEPHAEATPKKRGRPRLSEEVKSLRAKQAAEKKAQRDAAREEKARQKAAEKGRKDLQKTTGRSTRISKAADTDLVKPAPLSQPRDEATATASVPDIPTSGWKTLSMSPSVGEVAETMMVDELQSSSPRVLDRDEASGNTGTARPRPSVPKSPTLLATPTPKTAGITSATPLPTAASQVPAQTMSQPLPNLEPSSAASEGVLSQNNSVTKRPTFSLNRARFPRLSELVKQNMATAYLNTLPSRQPPAESKKTLTVFGNDDSSTSSSSSDSDEEPVSHIPKERRAGMQKK
jgi:hypothetical protein